jgi:hypothetical protein
MFLYESNSQLNQIYFQFLKGITNFIWHAVCLAQSHKHIVKDDSVFGIFIKKRLQIFITSTMRMEA